MKAACTVLGGGNFSNKTTYLDRPYAALLLLVIGYRQVCGFSNKVVALELDLSLKGNAVTV